jgi:hypothetical protein
VPNATRKSMRASNSSARLRLRRGVKHRSQSSKGDGVSEKGRANGLATLSVIATLIVAVLGSVTTMMAATMSAHNERDRAAESFRRGNQQTAYAEFLTATTELNSEIYAGLTQVELRNNAQGVERTDEVLGKLNDKTSLVDTKYNVIVLVGSDATRAAATELADAYNEATAKLRDSILQSANGPRAAGTGVPRAGEFLKQIRTLRNNFVASARDDLDAY